MSVESFAEAVQTGKVLAGKYLIDRVLGQGGMGIVVAATDTQLERRVAIKFLSPEYVQSEEACQRFLREARTAAQIQSEHIARVIDVKVLDSGSPYMVMEYLEGSDLAELLERRNTLPTKDVAYYAIQACEALAEAHARGIIHRDLKPANLFLARQPDGSSRIKVLDFGISKQMDIVEKATAKADENLGLTRTSAALGSPLYMSPEQMRSSRDVDSRTDIWAMGVIMYELLSGQLPFAAAKLLQLSAKIFLEAPPSLTDVCPEVPLELANIIHRCLEKSPDRRFQTIADLAGALEPFAPRRARQNVERCARLLRASRGYDGDPGHTDPPFDATAEAAAVIAPKPVPGADAVTLNGFSTTINFWISKARNKQLWIGSLVICAAASFAFFAARSKDHADPNTETQLNAAAIPKPDAAWPARDKTDLTPHDALPPESSSPQPVRQGVTDESALANSGPATKKNGAPSTTRAEPPAPATNALTTPLAAPTARRSRPSSVNKQANLKTRFGGRK